MTLYKHRQALSFVALPSYENWRAFVERKPSDYGYEVPLFTDAQLSAFGDLAFGPYKFFRVYPGEATSRVFKTMIVMRVDVHMTVEVHQMLADLEKSESSAYHGGDLDDEICGLLSLVFGIRLSPGDITREFSSRGDPRGYPGSPSPEPTLDHNGWGSLIPRLSRTIDPVSLPAILQSYPALQKEDATPLVKAARLYQQATWHSDGNPSYSWLTLVSAVETAANRWSKSVSSKKRFLDFILRFLPGPPEKRPEERCRFPFEDPGRVEEALRTIYHYRSLALHEGQPFPAPMCHPPQRYKGTDESAEICLGQASGTLGGNWVHSDTPILLHAFEHMVRTSLLEWWRSLSITLTGNK